MKGNLGLNWLGTLSGVKNIVYKGLQSNNSGGDPTSLFMRLSQQYII